VYPWHSGYGRKPSHLRSTKAKKATTAAELKPSTLMREASVERMCTPVKAPQLGQILAVASICLPQVLQLGMAQPFRPEQR
jgi:hypothetical protein